MLSNDVKIMGKRALSLLLSLLMLAGCMGTSAFADDPCDEHVPAEPAVENEAAASCTEAGSYDMVIYCSVCGEELSRETVTVDALGHDWDEGVITLAPTTETEGVMTYNCLNCDEVMTTVLDKLPPVEHEEPEEPEELKEAGSPDHEHSYIVSVTNPTCTENGYTTHVCSICEYTYTDSLTDPLGHEPEAVDALPPTESETGHTAGSVCARCGEILEGCEELPVLQKTVITIEQQPEDAAIINGQAEFTVVASVNKDVELSYQWQRLDTSLEYADDAAREAAWENLENETSATLILTGLDNVETQADCLNDTYRCVLKCEDKSETTDEVFVESQMSISFSTLGPNSEMTVKTSTGYIAADKDDAHMASSGWSSWTTTGNPAQDIVNCAKAQEGKNSTQLGLSGQWCAYFVAACARNVGISESVIPPADSSHKTTTTTSNGNTQATSSGWGMGTYISDKLGGRILNASETPQAGDIVYWGSHVAIMMNETKCISGNINNVVTIHNVTGYINGDGIHNPSHSYVRPNYSGSGETNIPTVQLAKNTRHVATQSDTSAVVSHFVYLNGASLSSATDIGFELFDNSGTFLDSCSDGKPVVDSGGFVDAWYTISSTSSEIKLALTPATTYKYRIYVTYGGTNYYSDYQSFTTTGFTVTYNANGGSGAPAAQKCSPNTTVTLSSTKPSRANSSAAGYKVTLNANGGSVSSSSVSATNTTSYTFKNWNTKANGSGTSYNAGGNYAGKTDVILYAQWTTKTTSSAVTLPTPTRAGYTFNGWGTSASATSGVKGQYTPTGNVTLYAVWKTNTLTMKYNTNGGTVGANSNNCTQGANGAILKNNSEIISTWTYGRTYENGLVNDTSFGLSRQGYSFRGWCLNANGSTTVYDQNTSMKPETLYPNLKNGNGTVTLYAIWKSNDPVKPADPVEEFVRRCYRLILGREGEAKGVSDWTNALKSGTRTGAEIVSGFINSQEFFNQRNSNEQVVTILYRAMLGREPDAGGKASWVSILDGGCSYDCIVDGFSGSQEFGGICASYGISAGRVNLTQPRDRNPRLTAFVNRNYRYALNRQGEAGGLNDWCDILLQKRQTPQEVAHGFVFSPECLNMNLDNRAFLVMLYHLYMDREPDESGLNGWLAVLNGGGSREEVANGFAESVEFHNIVASYGL